MDEPIMWLVAWTGGYEQPSFYANTEKAKVVRYYEAWDEQNDEEEGCVVQLFELYSDRMVDITPGSVSLH